MAKPKIGNEEFIRAWLAASDIRTLMKKLKMSKNACYVRDHFLRKHGIQLKRFGPPSIDNDYKALASLVASLTKEKE